MINNKVVTIIKENQFDKEWTLFTPCSLPRNINKSYSYMPTNDIIPIISKADEVHLILGRAGLPSSILNELKWVNKYIKFKLIAKNEEIKSAFSDLKFSEIVIDNKVDFNYLGIIGKENLFLIIDLDNIRVDDTFEKIFFENHDLLNSFNLNTIKEIYVIDKHGSEEMLSFCQNVKDNKIPLIYICDKKIFNKSIYDNYSMLTKRIVVSDNNISAIFAVNNDESVLSFILQRGNCIPINFPSLDYIIDKTYVSLNKNLGDLSGKPDIYTCYNGKLNNLNIVNNIDVNHKIKILDYKDFDNEVFDSSLTNNHNEYSNVAQQVTYNFELIPPIIDKSFKISSKYDEIFNLSRQWQEEKTKINIKDFNNKLLQLDSSNIFIETITILKDIDAYLTEILFIKTTDYSSMCSFKGYHQNMLYYKDFIAKFKENFMNNCKNLYLRLAKQNTDNKFGQFDIEISDYKKIIEEKQKMIEQGIDILSNKRRIEILNKKIDDLQKLKTNFEDKNIETSNKNSDDFMEKCKGFLEKKIHTRNTLSISNVLKVNDLEKTLILEQLFGQYLKDFYDFISYTSNILECLYAQDFPEDYLLFEKENKNYIIIEKESQFKDTQNIQKQYNLNCITRR